MKGAPVSIVMMSLLLAGISASGREPEHYPQELPWTGKPALSNEPVIEGMTIREWMAATVFQEFKFSGTLEEAISYMMRESRAVTPGGRTIGGFVITEKEGDRTLTTARIDLQLKGKNALEVIDALCAAAKTKWMLTPISIHIGAGAEKVPGGQDFDEAAPDPFAPNISDAKDPAK